MALACAVFALLVAASEARALYPATKGLAPVANMLPNDLMMFAGKLFFIFGSAIFVTLDRF